MLKNNLILAWRNFWNHKLFSLIKLSGLTIGICAALLAWVVIRFEYGFDKFEPDGDRIYRVTSERKIPDGFRRNAGVPPAFPNAVAGEVRGLSLALNYFIPYDINVTVPGNGGNEREFRHLDNVIFTRSAYFKMIPYRWIAGGPEVMDRPLSVVLTDQKARLYFPGVNLADIPGRTLRYDKVEVTVSGIVASPKASTDFIFGEFISYLTHERTYPFFDAADWGNYEEGMLVKLAVGNTPANIEQQFAGLIAKQNNGKRIIEETFHLQALADLHFNAEYGTYNGRTAYRPLLLGLTLVAIALVLLGCINFINLSTAQSSRRAKEIGVRKVTGSSNAQIRGQLLSETFLLVLLSALLALAILPAVLKFLGDLIPAHLEFNPLNDLAIPAFLFGIVALMTFLAGYYPALILTRFSPVSVLKNQQFSRIGYSRNNLLRKSLIVSQFVVAQFFIITTFFVNRQIQFTSHKDLGHRSAGILIVHAPIGNKDSLKTIFANEVRNQAGVEGVSLSNLPPLTPLGQGFTYTFRGREIEVVMRSIDSAYLAVYRIPLLAGRTFNASSSENGEVVINETMARAMGCKKPGDALGQYFGDGITQKNPVVGVVKDINVQSLHSAVKPLVFRNRPRIQSTLNIALSGETETAAWNTAIAGIRLAYHRLYPGETFNYTFYDQEIGALYSQEQRLSKLLECATWLTYFLSGLGLTGLVIYSTRQRTREIGIRKVFGAGVRQILLLLSKDLLRLVLLAILIAVPIAWIAADRWLQNFAFRIDLSGWAFLVTGLASLSFAGTILGILVIRAAVVKPVRSLRSE